MKIFAKRILALGIYSALMSASVQAATYEVERIDAISTHANSVVIDENNAGDSVLIGSGVKEFTVQYEFLSEADFDAIVRDADARHQQFFGIEDIEDADALRAGTPTDNDLLWVLEFLRLRVGRFDSQQYGDSTVLVNAGGITEEIVVFDTDFEGQKTSDLEQLTRSTIDRVAGITNNGWIFGSGTAPYLPVEFNNTNNTETEDDDEIDNYWLREFQNRAFYSIDKGQTVIPLVPPESTYGGISVISDISDSGAAIGYASTGITQQATNAINNADDDCANEEVSKLPEIVCVDLTLTRQRLTLNNLYTIQAFKWQIGPDGEVISEEPLPHLITPHPEDTRGVTSFAQAVNDDGTVVGYANGWLSSNVTSPKKDERRGGTYAVVFKDDRVVELNPNHKDHFSSRANDINNNGIVTGYTNNGSINEFYYIDTTDIDNMEIVYPIGFFTGSASTAKSINEAGLIVGNADVESHIGIRRTHGFLYDINADTFTNLNDFLACDSQYTIVDATHIDENNEILATAIIEVGLADTNGDVLVDSNGDPIIDEIAQAVRMKAIDGEIESCEIEDDKVERQGASFGIFMPLVLLIIGFRRRYL